MTILKVNMAENNAYNSIKDSMCNKIERSRMADFDSEVKNLNMLVSYYNKIPKVIENLIHEGKIIVVLSKIEGERLSTIFEDSISFKDDYLYKYGKELGIIHKTPIKGFNMAKQRIINDYPKDENYEMDDYISTYIDYLKNNKPNINYDTFIHGDFHYANVLWLNNEISGVIDWEYSGCGYKEQDIAWSLILRLCQKFMDNINDLKIFLDGYKCNNNYDFNSLKWCLINGYCHFYLMNKKTPEYTSKIKGLLESLISLETI